MEFSPRNLIAVAIECGAVPSDQIDDALRIAEITPDPKAWHGFINRVLLFLGGLSTAFSVIFFVAYNWVEMGRFGKFALVECLLVLSLLAYWKLGGHSLAGKAALLVGALILGALMALFGQTYQTGADPWQLFFNWAVLLLPWALISRFPIIWLLWIALINLSVILYHQTFGDLFEIDNGTLWLLFALNIFALAVWEALSVRLIWLAESWAVRLLGVSSGTVVTLLVTDTYIGISEPNIISWMAWGLWMALSYLFYTRVRPDIFMVAFAGLSLIFVLPSFTFFMLVGGPITLVFFLTSIVVILLGSAVSIGLRKISRDKSL